MISLVIFLVLSLIGWFRLLMEITRALEIVSYKLGIKLGDKALEDSFLLSNQVMQAIKDHAAGSPAKIDLKEYMIATKLVKQARLEAYKNENLAFLTANALLPEITTSSSGLQYKQTQLGSGESPTATDSVTVHYEGRLISGSVFDSSIARNQSAQFGVNKVIAGWTEGLQLMQVGSKYEFYIPHQLGYGDRGAGSDIPPFSTLIFSVELLSIGS